MRAFGTNRLSGIGVAPGPEAGRVAESVVACNVLNQMTELSRPESYSSGR